MAVYDLVQIEIYCLRQNFVSAIGLNFLGHSLEFGALIS